ncbi:hypothetical protein CASFOL_034573 [Castilleja foliolosa]|uniref:Uncharacterized protein n=1 Tax=Castilleja foliolosa TaxID=1961234 RepID=A0ABD3BRP3_9LAMI
MAMFSRREYRKFRGRRVAAKKSKEKELSVKIYVEEQLPEDPEIMDIAEMMRLNVLMAMKLAFERLITSEYTTQETVYLEMKNERITAAYRLMKQNIPLASTSPPYTSISKMQIA